MAFVVDICYNSSGGRVATLVLNRNSISVKLESDHLVIHRHLPQEDEPEMETLPVRDVDRVLVVGAPAVTMPVLARFLDRDIPCVFLTKGGRWRGLLQSGISYNVARRMRQYDAFRDPGACLPLARETVVAKLQNARRVIQRLCSNRSLPMVTGEHAAGLAAGMAQARNADSVDELRGVEGIGSFHYFRLLARFFPGDFPFGTRSRRPPLDPANALLSFAYTCLMNECLSAIALHGLDSALGFMHQDRERSPSLALDLMEPFRPAFADLFVLNLLNHGRFDPDRDFQRDPDTGGWYLDEGGRQVFLPACEAALTRPFLPRGESTHVTFRQAIDRQVVSLVRFLEDGTPPRFFRLA